MEGNQGIQAYTAGIVEMLLQSHVPLAGAASAFELEFLPALPKAWAAGSIRGLRARGGFGVDLAWRGGKLNTATVRAQRTAPCRIRSTSPIAVTRDGRPIATRSIEPDVIEFPAEAGATYELTAR